MQERARIVSIDGSVVWVVPLDIEACLGCANAECKKNGNVFKAVNRQALKISVGDEVRIAAPVSRLLRQALLSIGIPAAGSVCAYAAVGSFAPATGEGMRVGVSLAALVAGMVIVYLASRNKIKDLPEVVGIL